MKFLRMIIKGRTQEKIMVDSVSNFKILDSFCNVWQLLYVSEQSLVLINDMLSIRRSPRTDSILFTNFISVVSQFLDCAIPQGLVTLQVVVYLVTK